MTIGELVNDAAPMLETQNLSKVYGDGTPIHALDRVCLVVARGEFLVIMGPSGSGKSTLLNLMGTLDTPTSGRVIVDGIDSNTLRGNGLADLRRERIGFVFQMFNLVPTLTALENVMLPLLPYRRGLGFSLEARARERLVALGLGKRLDHVPGQLSGGEQQRVAMARALINNPRLVLADEPTGNLDSKAGEEIVGLLRRANRELGITLVLVTHDPGIAAHSDRVVYLQDGRLLNSEA